MDRAPSSFQLLGLDLLVSKDWHIWFIEANNYPLWPKGGWITDFTSKMGVSLYHQCTTYKPAYNPDYVTCLKFMIIQRS